ncbi:MAG: hypothetical protein IPN29_17160 [Saprospiraceae bacterium]|nr:hypothetical protein [Saprospiraceae bacterium]
METAATLFTLKSIKAENNICPAFDKTYTINIKQSPVIPQTTDTVCNSIDYKTNVFSEAGVVYKWSYKGNLYRSLLQVAHWKVTNIT